ncbi:MAG: hypothetical protein EBR82_20950 [Caulobacteraceae bacterium]|nr:hypothetical protein [Caulobacteraceae bacterium]
MTGFVSLPPNVDAQPPEARPPEVVANDGFWPDVDLVQLRDAVRLDTTISTDRLKDAVVNAMLELARTFADWRSLTSAANLEAVPARTEIGGVSDYVIHYTRALYSLVGADLGERLLGQSATAAGVDRRDELSAEVDQHRRNARWAQNDFLGLGRATVELL